LAAWPRNVLEVFEGVDLETHGQLDLCVADEQLVDPDAGDVRDRAHEE
jgi:hypothetical protein